jgi:hypothetical protein
VNLARIRPGEHQCHARDLSALVDIAGRDDEEVGILGNERVQVGHRIVLPDEAAGPVVPVRLEEERASHHLAPVVDAGGKGGRISRQNTEVFDSAVCAVLPKRGNEGCAVSAHDIPDSLAVVINGVGVRSSVSEVRKLEGLVVFPQYGVNRKAGAGSRGAHGLALIVEALHEAGPARQAA